MRVECMRLKQYAGQLRSALLYIQTYMKTGQASRSCRQGIVDLYLTAARNMAPAYSRALGPLPQQMKGWSRHRLMQGQFNRNARSRYKASCEIMGSRPRCILDWVLAAVHCHPQVSHMHQRCDCDRIVEDVVVSQTLPPAVPPTPALSNLPSSSWI